MRFVSDIVNKDVTSLLIKTRGVKLPLSLKYNENFGNILIVTNESPIFLGGCLYNRFCRCQLFGCYVLYEVLNSYKTQTFLWVLTLDYVLSIEWMDTVRFFHNQSKAKELYKCPGLG